MQTTEAFDGLRCLDCGAQFESVTQCCSSCGGPLDPTYDEAALGMAHEDMFTEHAAEDSLARFAPALPFDGDVLVTLQAGGTPLIPCPALAAEWGVDRVLLKDEARNPTGAMVDREMALAVTAASEAGAETVALPTTGNGGQAAAAYASRAGLASEAFAPSRTPFQNKAMINVHGGEMSIVGGRYPDAVEVFEDADVEHSLAAFETPYRHEGAKTVAYELLTQLDAPPDAVVHTTGHGTGLVGIHKGFRECATTGIVDGEPRLYAAQPAGCAPLVSAWDSAARAPRADGIEPVEYPDTICGSLEIPDPAGGAHALDALAATDGGAVAPTDEELLDAGLALAGAGVPASATGGAAVSGAATLAERGAFDADETVVLVNPATANREADLLRSRLMSEGV
jgi:threonine synthase